MKNNFILTESEKKRILGLHNKYINKPQTWVIKEEFTGTAGDGYNGDVAACKKDLPYNVAVKTRQIKSSSEWKTLRQAWGSDGSMTQNLKMRDEMCDGWRSGDSKDSSSEPETSDQVKKAWLDKQAVNYPSFKDKFEIFTKIPNFEKGDISLKDVEDYKRSGYKNIDLLPEPNYLRWTIESDWLANKGQLTQYVENGNIVKLNRSLPIPAFDLIGTWK